MSTAARVSLAALALVAAAGLGFWTYRSLQDEPGAAAETARATAAVATATGAKPVPEMRPVFSLKDITGRSRSITEWDGKSLVINFWATWCPPCRREIPMLKELHSARGPQGFEVIGIAIDFRDSVAQYLKETDITYPLLIGEQDGLDVAAAFGLGSMGLPFTVFTDKQGRIVTAHLGELHQAEANAILDAILEVNAGRIDLQEARTRITDKLKALDQTTA